MHNTSTTRVDTQVIKVSQLKSKYVVLNGIFTLPYFNLQRQKHAYVNTYKHLRWEDFRVISDLLAEHLNHRSIKTPQILAEHISHRSLKTPQNINRAFKSYINKTSQILAGHLSHRSMKRSQNISRAYNP